MPTAQARGGRRLSPCRRRLNAGAGRSDSAREKPVPALVIAVHAVIAYLVLVASG